MRHEAAGCNWIIGNTAAHLWLDICVIQNRVHTPAKQRLLVGRISAQSQLKVTVQNWRSMMQPICAAEQPVCAGGRCNKT